MKLCLPCADRRCEDRGPACDAGCQCPCALEGTPEELAEFARRLRSVPMPFPERYELVQ